MVMVLSVVAIPTVDPWAEPECKGGNNGTILA